MENKDLYEEISSIKSIMERSTKFISLSGLSGIMAGIYALIGAGIASQLLYVKPEFNKIPVPIDPADPTIAKGLFYGGGIEYPILQVFIIALAVLLLSIGTGIWLTARKAKSKKQTVWNQSSRALLKNGLLPLLAGGFFILMMLAQGYYSLIAPCCLIFYGLSLVAASQYTYSDVKWLGVSDIVLGLLATVVPGLGMVFWALGFGVMHILYGTVMYFKYDRENSAK